MAEYISSFVILETCILFWSSVRVSKCNNLSSVSIFWSLVTTQVLKFFHSIPCNSLYFSFIWWWVSIVLGPFVLYYLPVVSVISKPVFCIFAAFFIGLLFSIHQFVLDFLRIYDFHLVSFPCYCYFNLRIYVRFYIQILDFSIQPEGCWVSACWFLRKDEITFPLITALQASQGTTRDTSLLLLYSK